MHRDRELNMATAAMIALAEHGIPVDIQELLVRGDPSRGIPPNAISKALRAAYETGVAFDLGHRLRAQSDAREV